MGNLRGWEWLILLLIVLLLFGASRLPALARSMGKSMKIFRSEVRDLKDADGTPSTPTAPGAPDPRPSDPPVTGVDDGHRST